MLHLPARCFSHAGKARLMAEPAGVLGQVVPQVRGGKAFVRACVLCGCEGGGGDGGVRYGAVRAGHTHTLESSGGAQGGARRRLLPRFFHSTPADPEDLVTFDLTPPSHPRPPAF